MPEAFQPTVLFDGGCNLCHHSVAWIVRHDRRQVFQFAPLQSPGGGNLARAHGIDPEVLESVVLVTPGGALTSSDAVLAIAAELGGWWRVCRLFRAVPKPLRDWVYRGVARRRHAWFGRREACSLPPAKTQAAPGEEPSPEA